MENIFSFFGAYGFSITQLCCYHTKTTNCVKKCVKLFYNKTLFTKQSVGQISHTIHNLQTPAIQKQKKHLVFAPVVIVPI